jgi:beta-glucanase (GH16 family)
MRSAKRWMVSVGSLGVLWIAGCSAETPLPGPFQNTAGSPPNNQGAGGSAGVGGGVSPGGAAGSISTSGSGGSTGGDQATAGSGGSLSTAGSGGSLATAGSGGSAGSPQGGGGAGGAGGSSTVVGGSGGMGPFTRQTPMPDARGIYGHPDPGTTYPPRPGFTPYLVEEFNTPLDLNTDPFWTYGDGALYEGLTRMTPEGITFAEGKMVLTITQGEKTGGYSHSAADTVATKPLGSGELRTLYNNFRYGRYEVRMKAPTTGSNYIFTMFAYRTPAYLLWREIDIEVQASPANTFITNLITAPPGTRKWASTIQDATTTYPYGGNGALALPGNLNTQTEYHTYAFEWLPTEIKWYVDDVLIRVKKDGVGPNSLAVPKESTKIVMNLWVFTDMNLGGGNPANNVYPIAGQYDWFRFYKWDQDDTYPKAGAPGSLSATDLELSKNNANDGLPDVRPEFCTGADGMRNVACGP